MYYYHRFLVSPSVLCREVVSMVFCYVFGESLRVEVPLYRGTTLIHSTQVQMHHFKLHMKAHWPHSNFRFFDSV